MKACLETMPFLSVSIRSRSCLTFSSPRARRSWGLGTEAFCAAAVPRKLTAATRTARITMSRTRFNGLSMVDSFELWIVREVIPMGEMYTRVGKGW